MKALNLRVRSILCTAAALAIAIPAQAKAAKPDIVVTEQDDGKEFTLHGDQRLIIKFTSPSGTPYSWSALMNPDSMLAFTDKPASPPKSQDRPSQIMMVGGPHEQVFAFRAARFTETSSEWFRLIFCSTQCDLKDGTAKVFKIEVKTQRK
jgi:predicted secreted protein